MSSDNRFWQIIAGILSVVVVSLVTLGYNHLEAGIVGNAKSTDEHLKLPAHGGALVALEQKANELSEKHADKLDDLMQRIDTRLDAIERDMAVTRSVQAQTLRDLGHIARRIDGIRLQLPTPAE